MNSGAVGDAPATKEDIKDVKEVEKEASDVETGAASSENVEFLRSSATFDSNAFLQSNSEVAVCETEETTMPGIFCMFPPPPPTSVNFMNGTPFDILEKMKKDEEEVRPELSTQTIQFNGLERSESEFVNYASDTSVEKNPDNSSESLTSESNTSIIDENVKTSKDNASNTECSLDIESSVTQALTNVLSEEAKKISDLANRVIESLKNASGGKEELAEMIQKNEKLKNFIGKLLQLLEEKTELSSSLDKQNSALIHQAKSLKEVTNITKDLLGIRNMEVKHLHSDLESMENTIKEERTRHNLAVERVHQAMKLNEELKSQYLHHLGIFDQLKMKYMEKILDLSHTNRQYSDFLESHDIKFVPTMRTKLVEKIVEESVQDVSSNSVTTFDYPKLRTQIAESQDCPDRFL